MTQNAALFALFASIKSCDNLDDVRRIAEAGEVLCRPGEAPVEKEEEEEVPKGPEMPATEGVGVKSWLDSFFGELTAREAAELLYSPCNSHPKFGYQHQADRFGEITGVGGLQVDLEGAKNLVSVSSFNQILSESRRRWAPYLLHCIGKREMKEVCTSKSGRIGKGWRYFA
jgi:hypothetical protein